MAKNSNEKITKTKKRTHCMITLLFSLEMKRWFLCVALSHNISSFTSILCLWQSRISQPNRTHVTSFAFGVGIVSIYASINGVLRSYFGVRDSNGGFRSTVQLFINQKAENVHKVNCVLDLTIQTRSFGVQEVVVSIFLRWFLVTFWVCPLFSIAPLSQWVSKLPNRVH